MQSFDYIIVGAGSAGCILANRLSANPDTTVALIEAGGENRSIFVDMPSALAFPMRNRRFNWGYMSEPEPYLDGRIIPCHRGKGLGGSSTINGMVFVRGNPKDFDEWETLGAAGWNYKNCLPYFKKLENWQEKRSEFRGSDGPVSVNTGNQMRMSPLYEAFIEAGVQAGYPYCEDYNGESQEGFGPMQMNVGSGIRASTDRAYLKPISSRKNLHIFKNALVTKVNFAGKTAIGIEAIQTGKSFTLNSKREVILASGAIGSPQLLQLSGIGPADVLKDAGIDVLLARDGVGQNLTDHLEIFFQYQCKLPVTLNNKIGLVSKGLIGLRWMLFKSGLGASNHFESCGFIKSSDHKPWPDVQYHFLPGAISYDGSSAFKGHGYQVHVGPNKPKSRGHVKVNTSDPREHPEILFNYLKQEEDKQDWINTVLVTRKIFEQNAFAPYRNGEIQPGPEISSGEEILNWLKSNVETAYHPCSTCRMGRANDNGAVVDPDCKVIGVENLRVVDASIFPSIPNGNLNAPTMMVAERAADIILGLL